MDSRKQSTNHEWIHNSNQQQHHHDQRQRQHQQQQQHQHSPIDARVKVQLPVAVHATPHRSEQFRCVLPALWLPVTATSARQSRRQPRRHFFVAGHRLVGHSSSLSSSPPPPPSPSSPTSLSSASDRTAERRRSAQSRRTSRGNDGGGGHGAAGNRRSFHIGPWLLIEDPDKMQHVQEYTLGDNGSSSGSDMTSRGGSDICRTNTPTATVTATATATATATTPTPSFTLMDIRGADKKTAARGGLRSNSVLKISIVFCLSFLVGMVVAIIYIEAHLWVE